MSKRVKNWATSWKVALCLLLLTWIFHSIFMTEGRTAAARLGLDWSALSLPEQIRLAWRHGPEALWQRLCQVHPITFILSVGVMGLTIFLGVARWRMVLGVQGLALPWARAVEISLVAHFFNSFLLGSTGGDVIKAYYAARETAHKKTEAVVTVFADRLIGLWAMLLFATLMIVPNWRLLFGDDRLRPLALAVLAMGGASSVVVGLAFHGGVSRSWSGARAWLRRLPKGVWLERSLESCRQLGRERFFVTRALILSMLLNAVCVLQVWILSRGLNLAISPLALMVIVPTIICISALPVTPSGLGVRENLYVFVLTVPALQVPATSALSLSLLAYAGSLLWSIGGGLVYLTFRQRHHLSPAELEA